jgi:hypothetical protein
MEGTVGQRHINAGNREFRKTFQDSLSDRGSGARSTFRGNDRKRRKNVVTKGKKNIEGLEEMSINEEAVKRLVESVKNGEPAYWFFE